MLRRDAQHWLFVYVVALYLVPSAGAEGFNCGGNRDFLGWDGILYSADRPNLGQGGYEGGETLRYDFVPVHHDGPEAETRLFDTCRTGSYAYVFETDPGPHALTLRLADAYSDGDSIRTLSVVADGDTILRRFDVHAKVGKLRTLDVRRFINVTGSECRIEIGGDREPPIVNGIALEPCLEFPPPLPEPIEGLTATPTYRGALVTWDVPQPVLHDGAVVKVVDERGDLNWVRHRYVGWAIAPTDPLWGIRMLPRDFGGRLGAPVDIPAVPERDMEDSSLDWMELFIDPSDILDMALHINDRLRVPATLVHAGVAHDGEVNYRGGRTLRAPKKSYKFRVTSDDDIVGTDTIKLDGKYSDPVTVKELIARDIMLASGISTYQLEPWRLFLNGEYAGVYQRIEEMDEAFLERIGLDPTAWAYEVDGYEEPLPDVSDYRAAFAPLAGDDWDRRAVITMVEDLDSVSDRDLETHLYEHFDVDQILDWYGAQVYIGNPDFMIHNHLLYRGREEDRWRILPHDVDKGFREGEAHPLLGTRYYPGLSDGIHPIIDRMMTVPALRRRHLERLIDLIDTTFPPEELLASYDEWCALIRDDLLLDPHKLQREDAETYLADVQSFRAILEDHIAALRVETVRVLPSNSTALSINELHVEELPGSHWVEFHHRGQVPIELGSYYFTDDPNDREKWALPDVVLEEGEWAVALNPGFETNPTWLGIWDPMGGEAWVDTVAIPRGAPLASIGRYPDGHGRHHVLEMATPGAANTWSPPIEMELETDRSLYSNGGTVRFDFLARSLWRDAIEIDLEANFKKEGGVRVAASPAATITLPVVFARGQTWENEFEFSIPNDWAEGRYDVLVSALGRGDAVMGETSTTFFVHNSPVGKLVINELCAKNDGSWEDEAGDPEDWAELVNASNQPIDLDGLYLSDDPEDTPLRWALPDLALGPEERLLVWLDGEPEEGELHANFKLDRDGEGLGIAREEDGRITIVDHIEFGWQASEWSIGRYPDGGVSWQRFSLPSPGGANADPDIDL